MTHDSLLQRDWLEVVERLGGAEHLGASARQAKAFLRAREIGSAADLLRLILAYCLGDRGLRLTTAWASAMGLADISNVALLQRLRRCGDWLTLLVGQALAASAPKASRGRTIRIIDATTVAQAGTAAGRNNGIWRIHSAFDLPHERFGCFELTDGREAERLDRLPVRKGELRIADRVHLKAEAMAAVLAAGADVLVRAGWKSARWQDAKGAAVDLIAVLGKASKRGTLDRPIWLGRDRAPALALRMVAIRKPEHAAAAARRKARRDAQRERSNISERTLLAADWVILITSLNAADYAAADVLALYRLRWRIELAFKRLKSVVGLKRPPGGDRRSARPYLLAHLLAILLLEPLIDELEDSPPGALAA